MVTMVRVALLVVVMLAIGLLPVAVAEQSGDPKANAMLLEAAKQDDTATLEAILVSGKADINAQDEDGNTALHLLFLHPSFSKNLKAAKLLLAHGASLEVPNDEGWRPYEFERAYYYEYPIAYTGYKALLTKARLGINGKDRNGFTPLYYAVAWSAYDNYKYDVKLAQELVAEGADVRNIQHYDDYDEDGHSYDTLDLAAVLVTDKKDFLSLLAEEGEIDHVLATRGESLLRKALVCKNLPVVEVLLDHGVDPNAGMLEGEDVVGSLGRYGDVYGTRGELEMFSHRPSILEILLSRGADVHFAHSKDGYTPLHVAASKDNYEAAEFLLKYGASPNIIDKSGMTPLHYALRHGFYWGRRISIVELLLEHGASANIKGNDGLTPYDYVVNKYEGSRWESDRTRAAAAAAILLINMVGAEGKDKEGRAPVYWARLLGYETVQELRDKARELEDE